LHLVYYLLATFDLVTVCLGLYLINNIARIYTDSVAVNQVWAARLSDYSELSRLAAAVNAPGNDVFQTQDVDRESERLNSALTAFKRRAGEVRTDLVRNVDIDQGKDLLPTLDAIDTAMDEMVSEANLIFSYFRDNEPQLAGQRMAEMDRDFSRVTGTLAELSREVRAIQTAHFDEQTARAATVRKFELVIAGMIVLMVVGVTLYGHLLARRMRQTSRETEQYIDALTHSRLELARHRDHLEELVAERTRELEASHTRLRLSERLASMGTLAAGLGHDMNNVLFPIRCRFDALEAMDLQPHARTEISALRETVEYLQQLSDGLRLLALDPEDDQASDPVTHPTQWAREAHAVLRTAVPAQATLHWNFPDDLPAMAVAPHRLSQAVFNLVVNAGEAISGQGTVRIRAQAIDDRRVVRIEVTDDGAGIPDAVRGRVLDPFFTTKRRGLSTGLGLALVHGVATSAGGTLEIDSTPGQGTTVTLDIPAVMEPADRVRTTRRATVSMPNSRRATLVSSLLESVGFQVDRAGNGKPQGAADLWVADASCVVREAAAQFLNGSVGRQLIVLADDGEDWGGLGASVISRDSALETILQVIGAGDSSPAETEG
jgi:signal transduction histidine kinase